MTIDKIHANFTKSLQQDAERAQPTSAVVADGKFSVHLAPETAASRFNTFSSIVVNRNPLLLSKKKLSDWIKLEKLNNTDGSALGTKKYFERSIDLINTLVPKMIVTNIKDGKAEMAVAIDPKLVTTDNLMVHHSLDEGETIHFIKDSTDDINGFHFDNQTSKYAAMKALGMVGYEILMRGNGPPIMAFLPSTRIDSSGQPQLLLSLDDYDDTCEQNPDREQTKRQRASDLNNQGRISAAMIEAGVPYPLCRFVVDLLGGECSDGLLYRSDRSFDSFLDVIADLTQMKTNPEAFIHLSVRDQCRLAIGEKMHGRETEKEKLMEVAARVTGSKSNDALFEALALAVSQNKQQIAMVTGMPGSGKSRLVMETKADLENQGWLFLECKFDRIVHSEPLSIIAGAFDQFLKQCFGNSMHLESRIRTKLNTMMQPDDVSILGKHVPSLAKYIDDNLEPTSFEVSKEQIHQLFNKLIGVLSASDRPVLFFLDDLQWADSASIDLLLSLTKASEPELISSSDSSRHMKGNVLFIGSYRDNEVNENAELIQILKQLSR